MTLKASLIFNPSSGRGDPVEQLVTIRKILEPTINLDIYPIHNQEVGAAQLVRTAIAEGVSMILVAGGDGTISAVAEALINTEIPLGIIPTGTANSFARALGISNDIVVACQTILTGVNRSVDIALCNGKPMVLLAGIGYEAGSIEQAKRRLKKLFGVLAYIQGGIKEFWHLKAFETQIETENQTISLSSVAVTIANAAPVTSFLAHGAADVILDDGLLDVTIVSTANRTNALFAAYHLLITGFIGKATNRNDIKYLRAKSVKVRTEPPQKVVLDGNLIETTPVEVNCISRGLNVVVPSQ
ncbi:YegS/Rv2252/BmrU family lipid kinase [Chlorogloeopsis sp. ULAP02]|uniref:YegS/Rv2252/BmrU family lipid kinase n=1 Tax=Chlorogloeopsis sp. ULAP02 TaxID=3107926 RepID=UPI0031368D63